MRCLCRPRCIQSCSIFCSLVVSARHGRPKARSGAGRITTGRWLLSTASHIIRVSEKMQVVIPMTIAPSVPLCISFFMSPVAARTPRFLLAQVWRRRNPPIQTTVPRRCHEMIVPLLCITTFASVSRARVNNVFSFPSLRFLSACAARRPALLYILYTTAGTIPPPHTDVRVSKMLGSPCVSVTRRHDAFCPQGLSPHFRSPSVVASP